MTVDPAFTITPAVSPGDLGSIRSLFEEYAASLGFSLCFQDFEVELASLPGAYAPPAGRLFLARRGAEAVGCIGLRPLEPGIGELKRMYVRPIARGLGLGRALATLGITGAREAGYRAVRLDTLASMTPAVRLYRELGFREIPAYYENPLSGVLYFELPLEPPLSGRRSGE